MFNNFPAIELSEQMQGGKRFYTRNNRSVPSVTTILSATRNNSFLNKWNEQNPGAREEASNRGSQVHKSIENYLMGDKYELAEEHKPYFNSVRPFLNKFSPLFMEVPIFSNEFGFAGRVDCGGMYGGLYTGLPVLVDWKTSNKPKKSWYDYPLQLAAYCYGFRETYPHFPVDFHHTLIVCATPQGAQIELFDQGQIDHYWELFQERLNWFYNNFDNTLLARA